MRFRFVGNGYPEHAGSAAAARVIRARLEAAGRIVDDGEFDALVIHGAGSMHHGAAAFHGHMRAIMDAQERGKRTLLINSVWQSNPPSYDAALAAVDDLIVRGDASRADLAERHDVAARASIDLSFFDPIDETAPFVDLAGRIAVTDLYSVDLGTFAWVSRWGEDWIRLDLDTLSWSSLVRTLRTARALVTGRHHAMYAACRAGIPFVAFRGASHAMDDPLRSARSIIPVCRRLDEVDPVLAWALANRTGYDRLFDWMNRQPPWDGPDFRGRRKAKPPPQPIAPRNLARMAELRGAMAEAGRHWQDVATADPEDAEAPLKAGHALMRGGRLEAGATALMAFRLARPEYGGAALRQVIRAESWADIWDPAMWDHDGDPDGWWTDARQLPLVAARSWDDAALLAKAAVIIAKARTQGGLAGALAARFLMARRMLKINRHSLAPAIVRIDVGADRPGWIDDHDEISMLSGSGTRDPRIDALIARLRTSPAWASPDMRADAIGLYWDRDGATAELGAMAREALVGHEKHSRLATLAAMIAHQLDRHDLLPLMLDVPGFRRTAERECPPLATALVALMGDAAPAAVHDMAWLDRKLGQGLDRFVALLSDPARRIAVIGNSPCELGRGRGPEIDGHDVVIRFTRFSTAAAYQQDYGSRTDIIITKFTDEEALPLFETLPPEVMLMFWRPHWLFNNRRWTNTLAAARGGRTIGFIPHAERVRMTRRIGASPSTGMLLIGMMERFRRLDRSSFFGFSFVDQLADDRRAHYYDERTPSEIHDWHEEARLFEQMFQPSDKIAGHARAAP